jgi:hypothetical protein
MKVVRGYDDLPPRPDLESQYDPQAEYEEKASRYHVDRLQYNTT